MTQPHPLIQLRALLDALDMVNENEDWAPSSTQWKKIRQMIMDLPMTDYPKAEQGRGTQTQHQHHRPLPPHNNEHGTEVVNFAEPERPVRTAPVGAPGAKDPRMIQSNQPHVVDPQTPQQMHGPHGSTITKNNPNRSPFL